MKTPKQRKLFSTLFLMGIPLVFGKMTQYLHQVVDSAMMGHFGEGSVELGAIGIAGQFTWILNTLLWPLGVGVQALTTRRFGQLEKSHGGESSLGEVLDNGLLVGLFAGTLATILSFGARPALGFLIQDIMVLDTALEYIEIMRWSMIPSAFFFVAQSFVASLGKTRHLFYAGFLSNGLNIFFNWIFIFGNLGFQPMGIRGSALGTLLARLITLAYYFIVLVLPKLRVKFQYFRFQQFSALLQKNIIRAGFPTGIQNVIALSIFLTYQSFMEDYSTVYLAATYTVFTFYRLNKTIIGGFARSASILVGHALGEGDQPKAAKTMRVGILIGIGIAATIGAAVGIWNFQIAGIFTDNTETQKAIAAALHVFLAFYLIEGSFFPIEVVFTQNGYGRWVLISEFSTNVLFLLLLTWLVRVFFPQEVLLAWFCFGLYQIVHALLLFIGYKRKEWLSTKVE